MELVPLKVNKRDQFKKNEMNRLRAAGRIPAVIYGKASDTISVSVDSREMNGIFRQHIGRSFLLNISVEGDTRADERWTMVREAQRDPVTSDLLHLDFYELQKDKPMEMDVSLRCIGTPEGVKMGGILEVISRELRISCLPKDMPEYLEADISKLQINDSLHVSDLSFPNVTIMTGGDKVVAHVVTLRATKEETAAEGAAAATTAAPAA